MRAASIVLSACAIAVTAPGARLQASGSCADLSRLSLPKVAITLARAIAPGGFTPPGDSGAERTRALPACSRVAATLTPTPDSDIKMEVWLPESGWNGKLQAVGNGAFNGSIAYPALSTALARGYAASSTDTGHTGNNA